ncbi:MAG: HPF/RaiA family ribosome-associated protein [Boseongicola sp.]|nr:HPF/RaiA family ribosome-associated protein [Boseongicola sp.]MDD9977688.1 HPF/RaiA family ribosome-associated protein [Boseongicola sp.]
MEIHTSTDNTINGDLRVAEVAELAVKNDLGHMDDWLTRVDVHLKDQNGSKKGPANIRCTIEARPRGLAPMAAHADATDISAALKAAAVKLRARLQSEHSKRDPYR